MTGRLESLRSTTFHELRETTWLGPAVSALLHLGFSFSPIGIRGARFSVSTPLSRAYGVLAVLLAYIFYISGDALDKAIYKKLLPDGHSVTQNGSGQMRKIPCICPC